MAGKTTEARECAGQAAAGTHLSRRLQRMVLASLAVHRLLLIEQDLPRLLQGICDRLTNTDLNPAAWIVLLDSEVGSVITAESGLGDHFGVIMDLLRQSRLPECCRLALDREGQVVLHEDCRQSCCARKPDRSCSVLAVTARPRSGLFLFLVIELAPGAGSDEVEHHLVGELADSIARGIRGLFAAEEGRQREKRFRQIEERFQLALDASGAGLWDWNIKTGEMYTEPDRIQHLDYREAGGQGPGGLEGVIHPDDQERVLRELNEHLSGKSDEYRIEYRVRDRQGRWRWFLDRGKVVERDENNMPVRMTGTHQDITRQKEKDVALAMIQSQLHDAVDNERRFLQSVIDGAVDPVMAIDFEFTVLLMNRVATRIFRVDPDQIRQGGVKCYQAFAGRDRPCDNEDYPCPVRAVREREGPVTLIHRTYHGNGINNTFEIEASPLWDRDGELYGMIEVARDITDRLRIEEELRASRSHLYQLAHHDPLTGLPNRLLFRDRLKQALAKARRTGNRVAILFLDLDHFKEINDSLGHDIGDELLVETARRLQSQCRESDTVARLGGDEFVFILDGIRDRASVEVVVAKIRGVFADPVRIGDHEITVSVSIGAALYPDDSQDMDEVLRCADMALYRAKEEGRGTYRFYDSSMPPVPGHRSRG